MKRLLIILAVVTLLYGCNDTPKTGTVTFNDIPAEHKVEVFVDGKLFTNFLYPDNMEKQVLNPIYTASGIEVTRGYPWSPRPYERVDHVHHYGMWFNFGSVNGIDFWNNSPRVTEDRKHLFGTIKFTGIEEQSPENGRLVVLGDWVNSGDTVLLKERTTYIFQGDETTRIVERTTELTAQTEVVFVEDKEGLFGIRVDRAFEEQAVAPIEVLDANAQPTAEKILNNEGVTGVYRNAQGNTGADVWSKRSPWVALRGVKEGEVITIAVIDNPSNPGYPAWSHARGYGLFATNNLGGRAFDKDADELKITLQPGEKLTFKYRVIIGGELTDEYLNEVAQTYN